MPETCLIEFPLSQFPPVRLERGAALATELTAVNSPLLFGCRSGICGTCLAEIEVRDGGILEPPAWDEAEALELFAPGNPKARLACQVRLTANLKVRKINSL